MKEAVILAGGFGTRLRHVVSDVPKPMAPVAGRPFLCHLLDHLVRHGYGRAVLATGYMHGKIESHFGTDYRGMQIAYAREDTPLGTGGAIANALRLCATASVTVFNGDTLFLADPGRLCRFAEEKATRLAVVLRHVPDAGRYGAVDIDGTGLITGFREKDTSAGAGLINGGIYQVSRDLLDGYPAGEAFSFERDIMQRRYALEGFYAYAAEAYFIDIGVPEDYLRAQTELPAL